jgi:hypothetical protein
MEVSLDPGNPACRGGVCLVNHFRGRVTCPYGQGADGTAPPKAQPCTLPGTTTPVRPSGGEGVSAQCADRMAFFTVHCSCRCANAEGKTDDGASYCACPNGFECAQLVSGSDARSGGYCIRAHTTYDHASACVATCDATVGQCSVPDAGALPAAPDGGRDEVLFRCHPPRGRSLLPSAPSHRPGRSGALPRLGGPRPGRRLRRASRAHPSRPNDGRRGSRGRKHRCLASHLPPRAARWRVRRLDGRRLVLRHGARSAERLRAEPCLFQSWRSPCGCNDAPRVPVIATPSP